MAVTTTPLEGGWRCRRWNVTFALSSDTTATLTHGFPVAPDHVVITPLNQAACFAMCYRSSLTSTSIVLTKGTDPNSAGAQFEVLAWVKDSST